MALPPQLEALAALLRLPPPNRGLLEQVLANQAAREYMDTLLANDISLATRPYGQPVVPYIEAMRGGASSDVIQKALRDLGAPIGPMELPSPRKALNPGPSPRQLKSGQSGKVGIKTAGKGALGFAGALGLGALARRNTKEDSLLGQWARLL